MVKNKALPDSDASSVWSLSLSLSFSLSLPHRLGPIKDGLTCLLSLSLSLTNAVHPEGISWILPSLDPGSYYFYNA